MLTGSCRGAVSRLGPSSLRVGGSTADGIRGTETVGKVEARAPKRWTGVV